MPGLKCVSEADLRAFLLGLLPERVGRLVSAHLDSCPECEARARRLDRQTDPVVRSLRRAAGHAAHPPPAPSTADWAGAMPTADVAPPAPPPRSIGGYEVIREIGRGGMGVVYQARQAHPDRVVALKTILAGAHAGPARRARLLAEADAIARLRHPHVVQIYQVGQHEDLPFLALEYVDGGSLAQRLDGTPQPPGDAAALVEVIARAVHHAHEQGVVHRDLKPANVLLQAQGLQPLGLATPKVTDFGLAKLVAAGPHLTPTQATLGTPSYMAPEQTDGRNQEVGPAADVYALGAILYECLTGRPPFKAATPLETLALVAAAEPVAPRQLQPAVPRDLETICLQCLRKEPPRRYASARALADDLGRFRDGRPILARPVGRVERAAKWARRRPLATALLALSVTAVAALLAVWTALTVQVRAERDHADAAAREADRQRGRAEANKERALTAVDRFLTRTGEKSLASVPGIEELRRELLEDALELHTSFVADRDDPDPRVRGDLGRTYHRLGRIYGLLGRPDDQERAYQQAVAIQERLAREDPQDPEPRVALAKSYHNLALLYRNRESGKLDLARAEEALGRAVALKEDLARDHPDNPGYPVSLAHSLVAQGQLYRLQGRADLVEVARRRAVDLLETAVRDDGGKPPDREALAAALGNAGALCMATHRLAEAEVCFRRARDQYQALVGAEPKVRGHREQLATAENNLGAACATLHHDADALAAYERARHAWEQLEREAPVLTYYSASLAMTLLNEATYHLGFDRFEQARGPAQRAEALYRALAGKYPTNAAYRAGQVGALANLGAVAAGLGDWEGAEARAHEAELLVEPLAAREPTPPEIAEVRIVIANNRGRALRLLGRDREALPCLTAAIDGATRALKRDGNGDKVRAALYFASWERGELYAASGQPEAALADWERAPRVDPNDQEHARAAGDVVAALRPALRNEPARAAEAADELARRDAGNFTFPIAWAYVLAASSVERSQPLAPAERARLTTDYHRRAVALLERAERRGYFRFPEHRRRLAADPLFAPLRTRDDFKQLLSQVEKTAAAPQKK